MEKLDLKLNFNKEDLIVEAEFEEPIMVIADKINVFKAIDNNLYDSMIAMIMSVPQSVFPIILVDDIFMTLSDECKKFVLYHELGHYINGDLGEVYIPLKYKLKNIFNLCFVGMPIEEQFADLYAFLKMKQEGFSLNDTDKYFDELRDKCIVFYNQDMSYTKGEKKKIFKELKKCFARRRCILKNNHKKYLKLGKNFYDPKF